MRPMRRSVAGVVIACLLLAGCGSNEPSSTPDTPPSSTQVTKAPTAEGEPVCKEGCSEQEVNKAGSGCGDDSSPLRPARLIRNTPVQVGGLSGELALISSHIDLCPGIVWAWFQPAAGNTVAFEVYSIVDGVHSKPQASREGDASVTAYTVGLYAEPNTGVMAQPCVRLQSKESTELPVCLKAVEVVL